ncbi:nSTAND3 domain-containing NTPase [Streptomyces lavendulae]|uniref:nSTAND3 domain-containing NTPase n=1 Tax=Streptomyces lavendulae TaxID=1914 RepID=UPI0036E6CE28
MRELSVLSDVEFEELVGDLLAAEKNTHVERFAPGADGGIDLRWQLDGLHIAQCKHYRNSSFSQLYASAVKEVAKVEKLDPKGYLFVTSLDLSVGQKNKIYDLFKQWMSGPEDVLGMRDLDAMLTQNPSIESNHPKLWVTTGMQLFWHLHSEIANRTEALRARIEKAVPKYVVHPAYGNARELITRHNVCLISGPPGIGKTTLAQMILAEHISLGYEPIEVSSDIGEAWTALRVDSKQIFIYDDFLGQISFSERLAKNEDKRLSDLIERISTSKDKKLILTTREYVLRDAKRSYERLHDLDSRFQFVLELSSYRRSDRAQILYNHLWHSNVSTRCLHEISHGGYKQVIDHPGYSPRVIEYCTGSGFDTDSPGYPARFKATLDNPEKMWQIAFERHLTVEQRLLVIALSSLPVRVSIEKLQEAHVAFCRSMGVTATGASLHECLDVLEGTFISIERDQNGANKVRHINPSVTEFTVRRIAEDREVLGSLIRSSIYFEQITRLYGYGAGDLFKAGNDKLRDALRKEHQTVSDAMLRNLDSDYPNPSETWFSGGKVIRGGKFEERVRFHFQVDDEFHIDSTRLENLSDLLSSHWSSGQGNKEAAENVFDTIDTHPHSGSFKDNLHDVYESWMVSTLWDHDDWNHYFNHVNSHWCVDLKSNQSLATRFESHAKEELGRRNLYELDLESMQSIADGFGLEKLSESIVEAIEQGDREPDYDSYERTESSSVDDDRGADDYISQLFGRFSE